MGEQSAVLLPAEEYTDPDTEPNSKWIPEIDEDISDEFYPEEVQTTKAPKKDKKKNKAAAAAAANKRKADAAQSEDSEEDGSIAMETVD